MILSGYWRFLIALMNKEADSMKTACQLITAFSGDCCLILVENTVDGSEILHQLRSVLYLIIYNVLYIPCGSLGFLNLQQYGGSSANLVQELMVEAFEERGAKGVKGGVHCLRHESQNKLNKFETAPKS